MENPTGYFNLVPHELTVGDFHRNLAPSALKPHRAWADVSACGPRTKELAGLFRETFEKYESGVRAESKTAGPA